MNKIYNGGEINRVMIGIYGMEWYYLMDSNNGKFNGSNIDFIGYMNKASYLKFYPN